MREIFTALPTGRKLWVLYAAGVAAFVPAVGFYYVGEEAIFPISSLEMWHQGDWLRQHLFGGNLQHNPLFNWLIIALATLAGWEWMLQVARLVAIGATVSTGLVLAWLAQRLFGERVFAAFAAVVFLLLSDLVLYRGWLAYVDPLFGFFAFTSIACLWVACRERRLPLLALAVAALTAAFLTKAFSAYVFYGTSAFVLFWEREQRRFLLSPGSLALHAAGVAAVAVWLGFLPATEGQGPRMFKEIVDKLAVAGVLDYLTKLTVYAVKTLLALAPAALLAGYYAWKRRGTAEPASPAFRTAVAVAILNYLPYWLAPQSHIRYLVPLYPLAALVFAHIIWGARPASIATALRWFYLMLVLKLIFVFALFPYYQKAYRGENYAATARDIIAVTAGHPLYTTDVSASGLSVAGYIDGWLYPATPLRFPPAEWNSGFVIAYRADAKVGQIARRYQLGGNEIYLLCRGTACQARP